MGRLTFKGKYGYNIHNTPKEIQEAETQFGTIKESAIYLMGVKLKRAENKLGEIEDIEEEMGLSVKEMADLLKTMRKHCTNDGWSNGYVIKFWEMKIKELKLMEKWYRRFE